MSMMGISVVPLGTALVLVLGAAMLASTGLAQMLLITLNSGATTSNWAVFFPSGIAPDVTIIP